VVVECFSKKNNQKQKRNEMKRRRKKPVQKISEQSKVDNFFLVMGKGSFSLLLSG
jgi:hypothetical protein